MSAIEKIVLSIKTNQLYSLFKLLSIFKFVSKETPGKQINVIINTYNSANKRPSVFIKFLFADYKNTENDSFFGGFAIDTN